MVNSLTDFADYLKFIRPLPAGFYIAQKKRKNNVIINITRWFLIILLISFSTSTYCENGFRKTTLLDFDMAMI